MDEPRCSSIDPKVGTPERREATDLRALDGGDHRRGSTGKQATEDADLRGGTPTGVAPVDGERNRTKGCPTPSQPRPESGYRPATKERLQAGDQRADLERGGGGAEWLLLLVATTATKGSIWG
jgi:hypothetical protein